uniref:Uncharacterized protein n=1 Tax=Avena sativa TaxID=4498 RepID=A0ACD6A5R6_AVESA
MEDDSCRRAGAIPFKWEVCPGTPKHTRSASAAAAAAPSAKVAPKLTLTPPPSMVSSPSPYYHHHHHSAASSPRVSSARSASVSPSRRRPYAYAGGHRRVPPTAFIDAAPRAAATEYGGAGAPEADTAPPFGCFGLPMLRRKGSKKGAGFGFGSASSFSSSSSSSGGSSFRSDGVGLGMRRTASISSASSLPLPPGRRYAAEARAEVDAIAATGRGWYF